MLWTHRSFGGNKVHKHQVWIGHLGGILSISQQTFSYLYQGLIPPPSLCFISSSISVLKLGTLGWIEIISLGSLPCSPLPVCLCGGAALSCSATSRPWLNPKSGRSDKGAPALRTIRTWLAWCQHQHHQTAVHKPPSPAPFCSWVRQREAVLLVYNLDKRMMMMHLGCTLWSFISQVPLNDAGRYSHYFTSMCKSTVCMLMHMCTGEARAHALNKQFIIKKIDQMWFMFFVHINREGYLSKKSFYQNGLS